MINNNGAMGAEGSTSLDSGSDFGASETNTGIGNKSITNIQKPINMYQRVEQKRSDVPPMGARWIPFRGVGA